MATSIENNNPSIWFIADLHLSSEHPELITIFHHFLDDIKSKAKKLYILGDLFEFWVGDDIIDHPLGTDYQQIVEHLSDLKQSGVEIYLITGNRDFLLSTQFYNRTGIKPLPDYHVIDLYGNKVLICHGDTLCTDDKGYQLLRKVFRIRIIQKVYLALSIENRNQRAQKVRRYTAKLRDNKQSSILDVNQEMVEKIMEQYQVKHLIHGHTHRPDIHNFYLKSGVKVIRSVLGDWHDKPSYIEVKDNAQIIFVNGR